MVRTFPAKQSITSFTASKQQVFRMTSLSISTMSTIDDTHDLPEVVGGVVAQFCQVQLPRGDPVNFLPNWLLLSVDVLHRGVRDRPQFVCVGEAQCECAWFYPQLR